MNIGAKKATGFDAITAEIFKHNKTYASNYIARICKVVVIEEININSTDF